MMNIKFWLLINFLLFVLGPFKAYANIDLYTFKSEENRQAYLELTKELRCPKCQNQDIADSNAPIATDMRREVHRLLEEGKGRNEIIDFMTDRFGDFVTYKPKVNSVTFLLWFGPWILVLLGLISILIFVKHKSGKKESTHKQHVPDDTCSSSEHKKVEKLLSSYINDKENDA